VLVALADRRGVATISAPGGDQRPAPGHSINGWHGGTTRAIVTGLPDREQIVPGSLSGNITITAGGWIPRRSRPFSDPSRAAPWTPKPLSWVQAPSGQVLRIDTVRLRRGQGKRK
jgi:hypothetical protein